MYNKKVLIDSLKKLGSAKAPTQKKDMIIDPMGQWAHPGENTRIPSNRITMKGVNYPVLGIANTGQKQMMQPGQEYNFPGADYVDEYPQMKSGGLPNKKNSKKYSRSLDATNRLFAEHPWFKKPKSRKNKIYDPNAKYYQDGGEQGCPEGYAFNPKTGECIEWNPTVWGTEDENTSFDPIADIIYMNPNDRPEGMSDEEYNQMYQDQLEHEQLHRLQWLNDELQGESKIPLRMPSPVDNQDYNGPHYYNRRQEEADYLHDYWKNMHPQEAEFIPDDIIYNNETDPAMYELPWTVEGEARDYEYATRDGMPSFFPKRKKGGALPKAQKGLSYNQRMQAYNDSLAVYNMFQNDRNYFNKLFANYKPDLLSDADARKLDQWFNYMNNHSVPKDAIQRLNALNKIKPYVKTQKKLYTKDTLKNGKYNVEHFVGNFPKPKQPVKPKSIINLNQANNFITKSKPCVPKTTVINNVPEKAPFGKKLVGTDSKTIPVTGKKCEYVQTINPIYEDLIPEPIKIGTFPLKVEHGKLPELQTDVYYPEPLPEAPQYVLEPYTDERLRLSIEPGKTKSKKHTKRLFGHGQKYSWHTYKPSKDLELKRKEVVRLIPALVQKLTGYDPKYFEGYEDEEGNFVPGELDYGNATGSEMEFRGAASLRDYMNQKKYAKEYDEYQKKLDEWDERYEQSKKKQAEGVAFKYGGLSKFFDGGPQCPEDYTYNPETKRCERQRTDCPEGYVWDAQEGRCKSIAYREKSQLYSKGNKIVPTEEQEKYSWWPDDLTIKHLDPNTKLIHPSKRLQIYKPGVTDFSNEWSPADIPIYPDLNYEVIVDPSKPKGYNADKSIYYVPDENNLEFEKFKQYKKLKEVEKENLENLSRYPELTTSIINEDWGDKNSDPDYFQNPLTDDQITYDDYTNSKKNKYQECTDCSYGHGETFSYDDGYKNTEQNLSHVYNKFYDIPDYETRFEREYDYLDLPKESMIPKIDLESEDGYLPDWNESKDRGYIRGIHFDKGNTKSIKINLPKYHKHWMQTDAPPFHGTDPHYIKWKPIKGIETWKRESTKPRLIPRIVQKKTGYDPNYYYGYDKEIGDETIHVPGELEKAEQEGRPINFKGAKTFRDIKRQKEYNEKRVQYEKEKNDVRQRNEKYLEEYGISPEEYEQQYGAFRRGGQLPKAQDGIPQEFYQNWYQNRIMPTPEGQKLLDKIRPEALERSRQMIPYIYSDKLKPDDAGYYDTKTQKIILNKFLPEAQIEATKQHEFGHHIQAGDKFYNVLDKPHQFLVEQNIIEPEKINTGNSEWDEKLKENYDYVTQPDEMHARVMTLRRLAGFQPNQVITEKDLKDYFNRVKEAGEALDPDIEDLRGVTKGNQSIVNLLNDMVSVPSNREDLNVAQNGGSPYRTDLSPEDEKRFQKFYATLPENLQTDDTTYDIRGYWDSEGRPEKFNYDQPKENDGYYHAYSINSNTGKYLKSPWHPTFQHAVDEDRKIGYRPIVNVRGEVIATENPALQDEYIETELTPEEIEQYAKGGYIVEDISVPSLTRMKKGGLPCPPFCSPLIELSKGLSTIARNIPKTNSLNKFIANAATLADESLGQAFLSKSNAEAIAKGNQWLNSWIQHPTTQMKIKADMLDVINNKNLNKNSIIYTTPRYGDIVLSPKDQYIGALQIAQNYAPDVTPYSTKFSLSNLKQNKLNPMVDNIGISYTHQSDPIMRSLYSHGYFKPYSTQIDTEYKPFEHYGSFVSQSPKYSPYRKELTTIHEGTHDWISNKLLNETGQSDLILSNIDPEVKKLSDQLSLDPNAPLTKEEKKLIYLAKPTEVHARIMELRRHNNLSPSDYVDEDMAKHYLEDINNNKSAIDSEFSKVINNDPKILSKLMNDLYNIAIPLGVGIGGAALLKNPYKEESPIGGYKMGGEFELGDEVDEATMKELKKLGFTFQKI